MRCKTCHYSLEQLAEHRCPECGDAFDPSDPTTYEFEILEDFKRRTRFPYDIHRQPVRIAICVTIAILGGFILNSIARGTPQGQRWQLNVAGLFGALMFAPFVLVPVWWGYEAVTDFKQFLHSRFIKQRDIGSR